MISPLLTDLYQLTMAFGYWKLRIHEREAVFHLIFRNQPFKGHYSVAAGLQTVVEFLEHWHFSESDLAYLRGLNAPNGNPLFTPDFLDYLATLRFSCDIDAIPEGTLVFPQEPLLRVRGPLLQCQLMESTLLNIINFQTLIATKASRVCEAAMGDSVLEFGLRRAQGPDGALSASRAAYIGGVTATSNVLAGKQFGIPVSGTHAHSWVTVFSDEKTAFSAYASVMPDNCVLLVDTYSTIQGVKNAIAIGKALHEKGHKLLGIRLDSGDMATLSQTARKLLDEAGLIETKIIASNNLDEESIKQLKKDGAAISVWGVGTHLVAAFDTPALDGVYKLSALRDEHGQWEYKIKLSEQMLKVSNPGIHQVRRFMQDGVPLRDVIYDVDHGMSSDAPHVDLLQPVFRQGQRVMLPESIHAMRERTLREVNLFKKSPHEKKYPVELESQLSQIKQNVIGDVLKKNKSEFS